MWGFEDKENFTDDVFGAAPKDETVKKILLAIEEKGFKVKEAIKYVLVMKEKISLNGKTQINNGIVVVDPTVFITNISGQYNISKIIYKENDEKYVTLKKSTLQYILRSD